MPSGTFSISLTFMYWSDPWRLLYQPRTPVAKNHFTPSFSALATVRTESNVPGMPSVPLETLVDLICSSPQRLSVPVKPSLPAETQTLIPAAVAAS